MSGNSSSAKKSAETTKKKHGPDFFSRIGKIGGKKGHTGGFYANPKLASIAGAKGGKKNKGKKYNVKPKSAVAQAQEYEDPEDLANFLHEQITAEEG